MTDGVAVMCVELQGHAIKNKDLLTASGAITLKGPERFEELEDDIRDVRSFCNRESFLKEAPNNFVVTFYFSRTHSFPKHRHRANSNGTGKIQERLSYGNGTRRSPSWRNPSRI